MIIKLAQRLRGDKYHRRTKIVRAKRMNEDFLYETQQGWVQGHKGQWLVEIGERLRCNLDHEAFLRNYKPLEKGEPDE